MRLPPLWISLALVSVLITFRSCFPPLVALVKEARIGDWLNVIFMTEVISHRECNCHSIVTVVYIYIIRCRTALFSR